MPRVFRRSQRVPPYDFMRAMSIHGGNPMISGDGVLLTVVASGASPKGPPNASSIIALMKP